MRSFTKMTYIFIKQSIEIKSYDPNWFPESFPIALRLNSKNSENVIQESSSKKLCLSFLFSNVSKILKQWKSWNKIQGFVTYES